MNSMSVVTPNRLEMKHSGGNNITKGVATITGQCNSSTFQLAQLSVFWWEDPLCQGPVQQEERFTSQDIIGDNERDKMRRKNQILIKTSNQGRVIVINDCVLQQSAIMTNVWLWVFDSIKCWVTSITMQSLGSLQLLPPPQYIPPLPLPSSLSLKKNHGHLVRRGPRPSDSFLFNAFNVPWKTYVALSDPDYIKFQ